MNRKKETLADLTPHMRAALMQCAGRGVHPKEFGPSGEWPTSTMRALVAHGLIHMAASRKGRPLWRPTDIGRGVVSADEPRRRAPTAIPKWARSRDVVEPRAMEVMQYWRDCLIDPRFVYFIQEEDDGAIKIGQAIEPLKRLASIQTGNSRKLRIVAVVLAGLETESVLHNHWRPVAGIRGEWFGRGEEAAILATAEQIAVAQIEAHRRDEPIPEITEKVLLRALFA